MRTSASLGPLRCHYRALNQASLSIALLLIACMPLAARGWGCEGHETIALIAEKYLTPQARRVVHDLLSEPEKPASPRLCRKRTSSVIAEASMWADEVRRDKSSRYSGTGPWHFLDIPLGASAGDPKRFCPREGCVLTALERQLRLLETGRSRRQRADALRFVLHLVGDVHQPLHATTNSDSGGNCFPVVFLGVEPSRSNATSYVYQPNLHAVWDSGLVRYAAGRQGPARLAAKIEERFRNEIRAWQRQPIDVNRWLLESHEVGEQVTYGALPVPVRIGGERSGQTPSCARTAKSLLALDQRLTEPYLERAIPVMEEQLAKAGIRLAMVLNGIRN